MEDSQEYQKKIVDEIPMLTEKIPSNDKFLYFFEPQPIDDKCVFNISLKTGVLIIAGISLVQAISYLIYSFSHSEWLDTFADIICAVLLSIVAFYTYFSTKNENPSYVNVGYLAYGLVFAYELLYFVCKGILRLLGFINPLSDKFLNFKVFIYIFGKGVYLFIILYFVYILYCYMQILKHNAQ